MKQPKIINGTKVVIGPCRLSYTHLFEKYVSESGGEGKYMTNVLIPKSEKETVKAVKDAIEEAKKKGLTSKWNSKMPRELDICLRDGDAKFDEKGEEIYQDTYYVNAKASTRPGVVDKNMNPIMDEEEVYSGMWAYVSIEFYPYKSNGKCGIACGLGNVMKFKDDDRLGGRASASSDFDGYSDDDDDL